MKRYLGKGYLTDDEKNSLVLDRTKTGKEKLSMTDLEMKYNVSKSYMYKVLHEMNAEIGPSPIRKKDFPGNLELSAAKIENAQKGILFDPENQKVNSLVGSISPEGVLTAHYANTPQYQQKKETGTLWKDAETELQVQKPWIPRPTPEQFPLGERGYGNEIFNKKKGRFPIKRAIAGIAAILTVGSLATWDYLAEPKSLQSDYATPIQNKSEELAQKIGSDLKLKLVSTDLSEKN
jgi:hypothetical protein